MHPLGAGADIEISRVSGLHYRLKNVEQASHLKLPLRDLAPCLSKGVAPLLVHFVGNQAGYFTGNRAPQTFL